MNDSPSISWDLLRQAQDRSAEQAYCVGIALGTIRNALTDLKHGNSDWARKSLESGLAMIAEKQAQLVSQKDAA